MDSANQNIFDLIYKSTSYKCNSILFPFKCGLIDFIIVAWVEAYSVLTDHSYPLVAVTDRIPYASYKSKYYRTVSDLYPCGCAKLKRVLIQVSRPHFG